MKKILPTFSDEDLIQELSSRGYSIMPPFEPIEPMQPIEFTNVDWNSK